MLTPRFRRTLIGICLTYSLADALAPSRGIVRREVQGMRALRQCSHLEGATHDERSRDKRITPPTSMGLRGGGATSGIWETFNRIRAEGPSHASQETAAQTFNETTISMHRSNQCADFAVKCDAKAFRGDRVEVVGNWSPPYGVAGGNRTVQLNLVSDSATVWRGRMQLPPGELEYRYVISRSSKVLIYISMRTHIVV